MVQDQNRLRRPSGGVPTDFDVIVIGSGAGGGTLAYACAEAGRRVCVVERGKPQHTAGPHGELGPADESAALIDKQPYDDRTVQLASGPSRLYMSGRMGGGTSLYGAALLRPSRDDFSPGRFHGMHLSRAKWDWPIQYEDLEPHYLRAEELFDVQKEDVPAPLESSEVVAVKGTEALAKINQRMWLANEAAGLRPFRLPLAIDMATCQRCAACPGHLCPTGARRSSARLMSLIASRTDCLVRSRSEVVRIVPRHETSGAAVEILCRDTGRRERLTAKRVVLAAGAIGSTVIAQRSGWQHPLIGRNYMMHVSPIVVGVFPGRTHAENTFVKELGFADYYVDRSGTHSPARKLGLIQSLPVPGPQMLRKTGLSRWPESLVNRLRKHVLPLAGTVEDLPQSSNRVSSCSRSGIRLQHRFSGDDHQRSGQLAKHMGKILRRAGAKHIVSRSFPSKEHVAHQCGTLSMSKDRRYGVTRPDGRLFEREDVFVVDGSVLPSSLGVGPALTIMANALRVAETVAAEAA